MRVNKAELAVIIGVSLPTVSAYMLRYGDAFPVLDRGGRGRDWSFDSEAVQAFLAERRAQEDAGDQERQAALNQLVLPMQHNGGPALDAEQSLRPAEMLALMKVRRMRREEEYACGRLVEAAAVEQSLADLFGNLGRAERRALKQFAAEHGLGDDLVAGLVKALADCQRDFVRYTQSLTPAATRQGQLFGAAAD